MERNQFLKSAAILSFGGLAAKGIGALYRITLSNFLGGYGMGLYQMAYPLFCVLLTFSSAGIPSAFSRLIARETARGRDGFPSLKTALRLFALIGVCGTAVMCLFAPHMSRLQGETGLLKCYLMLAPSVFFVSLIAVLRGYFQGKNDMRPTALSEILEQTVKTGLGLFFAARYRNSPLLAVSYSLLSVTLSEAAALGYLFFRLKEEPRVKFLPARARETGGEVLLSALPVMAATGLLPLSQTADSVILIKLLRGTDAIALYGLFAGNALSLINLPASACYGLAASSVPAVSGSFAKKDYEQGRLHAARALLITLGLSVPCALGLLLFAKPIVSLLYPALGEKQARTLVALIRTLSFSAAALSGTDTLAACLTGMGRAKQAALSMLIAVTAKFALQCLTVGKLSVLGAAAAANACYFIAFFLDLYYTLRKKQGASHADFNRTRRAEKRSFSRRSQRAPGSGRSPRPNKRIGTNPDA